ncbi:hypothetical protein AMAG_15472 [Allomyces macrogynus ATCC 38327]|uniref:Myotubularin phosphatase domain-containing protein n=1 Tax=Allomyces macrogynus (strain ATCC 38327) TaxID=578462 RepID=A0A0L0T7C9_ALLM3|nr:hypothetical protein AMAG_15472 [Allomyces macrogynus ATCC 38327]|eukprot:KNE70718.1 hypothetical protein AMAG_15472 [Allomyces macrogynus ATCC 38327]
MEHLKIAKVENVLLMKGRRAFLGTLHLTAHQMIFRYAESDDEVWVFYSTIHDIVRHALNAQMQVTLDFRCRNFLFIRLLIQHEAHANDVYDSLTKLIHLDSPDLFYAFHYHLAATFPSNGWTVYDPRAELARQGVTASNPDWRLTDLNLNYQLCGTYPAVLCVPARISDLVLRHAAKHRSKARLPALTFRYRTGAAITRCSQPLVGLKQNRSLQDEKLVDTIFATPVNLPEEARRSDGHLIVDARPSANAMANTAKGAGTEIMEYYRNCRKEFMGIDNIHVMRDSLSKMVEVITQAEIEAIPINPALLERSGWLRHIKMLLDGTQVVVDTITSGHHVLVHCSDGWDRTAQLCALAQVCLDPFYRTIRGFEVLIEKDWCAFGHKFADRSGHMSTDYTVTASGATGALLKMQNKILQTVEQREVSPVFHQFLDCVYQLTCAYPTMFEFNEAFLIMLHFHVYSCQYGTFLFNTEQDRIVHKVPDRTHSLWSMVNSAPDETYRNPNYVAPVAPESVEPLSCKLRRLRYWTGLLNCPSDHLVVDAATMQFEVVPPDAAEPSAAATAADSTATAPTTTAPAPPTSTTSSSRPSSAPSPAAGDDPATAPTTSSRVVTPTGDMVMSVMDPVPPSSTLSMASGAVVEKVSQLWSRWRLSGPEDESAAPPPPVADPLGHQELASITVVQPTRGSVARSR